MCEYCLGGWGGGEEGEGGVWVMLESKHKDGRHNLSSRSILAISMFMSSFQPLQQNQRHNNRY